MKHVSPAIDRCVGLTMVLGKIGHLVKILILHNTKQSITHLKSVPLIYDTIMLIIIILINTFHKRAFIDPCQSKSQKTPVSGVQYLGAFASLSLAVGQEAGEER